MKIKNRIKELRLVKVSELKHNSKNWREHPQEQRDAMKGVLAEIGYVDALLARELPNGTLELLDGHLRAETTPNQEVPVLILELSDEEADTLLAVFDPIACMAEANQEKFNALLNEIKINDRELQKFTNDLKFMINDEMLFDPPNAPDSVEKNMEDMQSIKDQRRQGNENIINKTDTEKYMIIVFPDRESREKAMEKLGLPKDERYVVSSTVSVRLKGKSVPIKFTDNIKREAADKKKSGSCG